MFGLLVVNKPVGMTSRDAVNRVQRIIKPAKVGHAGTLDPIAEGVLVLCLGPATRLIEYVQQMPKRYVGTFRLGVTSPSDDIELPAEPIADAHTPTHADIQAALPSFIGQIEQVPPAYSAVRVRGEKAYERARRGERVELTPRTVAIHGIDLVRYEPPELVLDIRCGSGTYIRSLGRDLAQSLGTGAVMTHLVRTAVGGFTLRDALPAKEITPQTIRPSSRPAVDAVPALPQRQVNDAEAALLQRGMPIAPGHMTADAIAAVDAHGELVALVGPKRGGLWPTRVFKKG